MKSVDEKSYDVLLLCVGDIVVSANKIKQIYGLDLPMESRTWPARN